MLGRRGLGERGGWQRRARALQAEKAALSHDSAIFDVEHIVDEKVRAGCHERTASVWRLYAASAFTMV
jgi:hypothetical protein